MRGGERFCFERPRMKSFLLARAQVGQGPLGRERSVRSRDGALGRALASQAMAKWASDQDKWASPQRRQRQRPQWASPQARGLLDFNGSRVQVVQVGLGTNSTFVQNLGGKRGEWCPMMDWLLKTVSERSSDRLQGVAVEPVTDHARAMRAIASRRLPNVQLVEVALGEKDEEGVEIHALTDRHSEEIIQKVSPRQRTSIEWDLAFLRNMSCVGTVHPGYPDQREWLLERYGLDVDFARSKTTVWSFGKLAWELNFRGCELLIIDAEGCDAAIVRSLMAHCRDEEWRGRDAWPYVIQFETMGHCDRIEGANAEWGVITELENSGYTLIAHSHYNSQLVRTDALKKIRRVRDWASTLQCWGCNERGCFPYVMAPNRRGLSVHCRRCVEQWLSSW